LSTAPHPTPHAPADGSNGVGSPLMDQATRALPLHDPQVRETAERMAEMEKNARRFVKRHPTATVVGAVCVGFLIGRLLTR